MWFVIGLWATTAAVAQEEPTPVVRFTVERFVVEGENPLSREETQAILGPFAGEHAGLEGLLAAADALERAILDEGFAFRRVVLPAQTLQEGVVRLRVVSFKLGSVQITGNEHFSEDNVRRSLPALRIGEVPDTRRVARGLSLANEHPAKDLELTFSESREANALDAKITVDDRKPWRVFSAWDNTGSDETGDTRLSFGAQHSNLFDRDHVATLSYVTSPGHEDEVKQFGANYEIPLYELGGSVSAFYTHSDVDTGLIAGFFNVSGSGDFVGVRYSHTLPKLGRYSQKVTVGFDNKLFDNEIIFAGVDLGEDVRSTPLSVRYSGVYQGRGWQGDFYVEYARNVPVGGDNDSSAYQAARAGADEHWDAVRLAANAAYGLGGGWLARGVFLGQFTDEPLIPGEQFGLGGVHSVRGFDEREVAGDNGYRVGLEVWAPPLPYGARVLGFVDLGHKDQQKPQPGEEDRELMASVGAGFRWQWRENFSVLVDVARVVEGVPTRDDGTMKAHFSLLAQF